MHFTDPKALAGLDVIGSKNVRLGVVDGVYADIRSGQPQWVAVRSGLFGADVSLIPLGRAECDDRSLRIPYSVQQIRDAPHRASGTMMSHKEEANLFRHYGIGYGTAAPSAGEAVSRGRPAAGRNRGAGRIMLHKYAAPATDNAG
jgi:PRC-barrel domain